MHLQIEEQDVQFHFRQLKFDLWTFWKNFINSIRHFFRWRVQLFTVCVTTYPIKFTYLESWALDLSPTQIIPTLSRLFFSSNSFLIVLQIDEWTPPHNPRSDVNATYSVWNEIKGNHLSIPNVQRSFRPLIRNTIIQCLLKCFLPFHPQVLLLFLQLLLARKMLEHQCRMV